MSSATDAQFFCQNCRTPIKLDSSLENLSPAAFDLLVGASNRTTSQKSPEIAAASLPQERKELHDRASSQAQSPVFRVSIPSPNSGHGQASPPRNSTRINPSMSFVILDSHAAQPAEQNSSTRNEPQTNPVGRQASSLGPSHGDHEHRSLSHQIEQSTRLFEIMSARSDINYPVCSECSELLLESMQRRLNSAIRERDASVEYLKKITSDAPTEEEMVAAKQALDATRKRAAEALTELERLEKERASVEEEIADLEEQSRQMDTEEDSFWRERNSFTQMLSDFLNERDAINLQYDHDTLQLERLQRTNVYNDAFCIGHDGFFGTINGLRLGRLPANPVEWTEINAAWGQTLLLLVTVANKLGFTFDGYRLRPIGSHSIIEKLEYPQSASTSTATGSAAPGLQPKITVLELYSSGDLPLGLTTFLHRKFDNAMVAFLECLRQLGEFVEQGPKNNPRSPRQGLKLPYEIKKDRIGDASIKLGLYQDEAWTRACKYTLTCSKFLLAHASNVSSTGRRIAI
ncbi:MAG: autophagy protein 6 [Trizodia sp. TS-e1964]|nr:MAG: autophagy protein 6 [Trizodia sp. TS-e1964]